jgi:hypothetical protein
VCVCVCVCVCVALRFGLSHYLTCLAQLPSFTYTRTTRTAADAGDGVRSRLRRASDAEAEHAEVVAAAAAARMLRSSGSVADTADPDQCGQTLQEGPFYDAHDHSHTGGRAGRSGASDRVGAQARVRRAAGVVCPVFLDADDNFYAEWQGVRLSRDRNRDLTVAVTRDRRSQIFGR